MTNYPIRVAASSYEHERSLDEEKTIHGLIGIAMSQTDRWTALTQIVARGLSVLVATGSQEPRCHIPIVYKT
jgi:hypothetical protein